MINYDKSLHYDGYNMFFSCHYKGYDYQDMVYNFFSPTCELRVSMASLPALSGKMSDTVERQNCIELSRIYDTEITPSIAI